MQLSEHFSLEQGYISETAARRGIDNTPPDLAKIAMLQVAPKLEKVQAILGFPIHINSWYRCLELNTALGSKPTSDHIKGAAVDFICPEHGSPLVICETLISSQLLLRYKQLILEHTWVHISWDLTPGVQPKLEVLSLLSTGGYSSGLTSLTGESLA
jgi:hypothetical protein